MSDSNNDKPYKSPPASIDNPTSWGPFSRRKIPPDDYHTCPCCNGYGFVGIVDEQKVLLNKQDPLEDDSGV